MQIKKEWEIVKEAEGIVESLCRIYPEKLGHVKPEAIGCAQITNKDKPESDDSFSKIVGVKDPINLYCSKVYIICFFKATWDALNGPQKAAMLMAKLLRIPDEFDGAVLPEDLKDAKCLVKNFGVDYMENPKLPDLTKEKVAL